MFQLSTPQPAAAEHNIPKKSQHAKKVTARQYQREPWQAQHHSTADATDPAQKPIPLLHL
jgi:hypothetical protein